MKGKTLDIIYENDQFIAMNKAPGMLTIPDRHDDTQLSLYKSLSNEFGKIFIVHRLDRETSGLVLFAKNESSHKYLSQLFEKRNIEKKYLGIVKGSLPGKTGLIDEPVGEHPTRQGVMAVHKKGKPSLTHYSVMEEYGFYSLLQFNIQSGRTHQIRVHMKYAGRPIVCDQLYGDGKPVLLSSFKKKYKLSQHDEEERPIISRLALHSHQLAFTDENKIHYSLEAQLPRDMKALLQQLKKNRK